MPTSTKSIKKDASIPDEPSNNKSDILLDVWIRPLKKTNFKMWVHNSNNSFTHPSLGIGLGTKIKPNIFSFVILDDASLNWFEKTLAKSIKIFKKYNKKYENNNSDNTILWLKKRDLDKLRKISISLFVVNNGNSASIRLLMNSKASLYDDLNLDDINWIVEILNIAKYTLDGALQHE